MIVAKFSSRKQAEQARTFYASEEEYARWTWRITILRDERYPYALVQVPKSQLKDAA